MTDGDKEWLQLYLRALDAKVTALAADVKAHMSRDLLEHSDLRKDLNELDKRILRWIVTAALAVGAGTAGANKILAAVLGS